MFIYTINDYIQNDATMQSLVGATFYIKPYSGDLRDSSPVLSYEWRPNIVSPDSFFINNDIVVYTVADTDIDRAFQIRKRYIELLNVGNAIALVTDSDVQPSWSFLVRSTDYPAKDKDGFYEFDCYFEIGYIRLD